jgi:hypothetical protein
MFFCRPIWRGWLIDLSYTIDMWLVVFVYQQARLKIKSALASLHSWNFFALHSVESVAPLWPR